MEPFTYIERFGPLRHSDEHCFSYIEFGIGTLLAPTGIICTVGVRTCFIN